MWELVGYRHPINRAGRARGRSFVFEHTGGIGIPRDAPNGSGM